MGRPLRILYAAGPGDVLGTYQFWRAGKDDPSQVSMTYSGQFYDLCRQLDAEAYVISSSPTPGRLQDGRFLIQNRPILFQDRSAILYHLGQMWSATRLIGSALWFRPDVMVIVCGTAHWFPLRLLKWFGIRMVPAMFCVIWPKGKPLRGLRKLIGRLNRGFFTQAAAAIMTMSQDITHQVKELTDGQMKQVYEFLPTYRPEQFAGIGEPPQARDPFRVFFAGRIERVKGVFDLLAIACRYRDLGRTQIEFDLCGSGSALEELRLAVKQEGLTDRFRCHGHCDKETMRQMFARCHVVVVPTTSAFVEGFNQVVAEGVLSGRPVVTSSVCPALNYVREAVVEVAVDDVIGYGDAILKLCDDLTFYENKVAGCHTAQGQFYNLEKSWGETLNTVLCSIGLVEPGARGAQ